MGNLSNFAELKLLEHSVGKTSWSKPSVYVALYTVAPTDSTAGTEVTGGNYYRVKASDADNSVFGNASNGTIRNDGAYSSATTVSNNTVTYNLASAASNGGTLTFPQATANWGTVVAVGLLTAATGSDDLIWYGTLAVSKTVNNGDTVTFSPGDLVLGLD